MRRSSSVASNWCAFSRKSQISDRHPGSVLGGHRRLRDPLRQVLAVDVLHVDVEVAVDRAVAVDARHVPVHLAELFLQEGAPPLGFADVLRIAVRADLDELERHLGTALGVRRQVDVGHPAPPEAPNQPVLAEVTIEHGKKGSGPQGLRLPHLYFRRGAGVAPCGGAGRPITLSRSKSALLSAARPQTWSSAFPAITLPKNTADAPS